MGKYLTGQALFCVSLILPYHLSLQAKNDQTDKGLSETCFAHACISLLRKKNVCTPTLFPYPLMGGHPKLKVICAEYLLKCWQPPPITSHLLLHYFITYYYFLSCLSLLISSSYLLHGSTWRCKTLSIFLFSLFQRISRCQCSLY